MDPFNISTRYYFGFSDEILVRYSVDVLEAKGDCDEYINRIGEYKVIVLYLSYTLSLLLDCGAKSYTIRFRY